MTIGASLHGTGVGPNSTLGNMANSLAFGNSGGGFFSNVMGGLGKFGDFMGSPGGQGLLGLGATLGNLYGMNKSLGIAEDQLGIMKDQENRAATAQNFQTGNSLAMALQMTTPGTPEHERIKQAMAQGTYSV